MKYKIILLIILILYLLINDKEQFNEGSYKQLYGGFPYNKTNLDTGLFSMCKQNIRNDGANNRYCYDLSNYPKYHDYLYKSKNFVKTTPPSYFHPAYSTSYNPEIVFSSDWLHRFEYI